MLLTLIMKQSGSGRVCRSCTKAGLDPKEMSLCLSTHHDLSNKSLRWQWKLGWLIRPRVLLNKCVYLLFIQIAATEFILKSNKLLHSQNWHPNPRGQNGCSACYQVTKWAKYTIDWVFSLTCSVGNNSVTINDVMWWWLALKGRVRVRKPIRGSVQFTHKSHAHSSLAHTN